MGKGVRVTKRKKPRTVEIVKSSYQPTQAEMKDDAPLKLPGQTVLERIESLADAMLRPVKFRRISKPRTRR